MKINLKVINSKTYSTARLMLCEMQTASFNVWTFFLFKSISTFLAYLMAKSFFVQE